MNSEALPDRQHAVTRNEKATAVHLPLRRYLAIVAQAPADLAADDGSWAAEQMDFRS